MSYKKQVRKLALVPGDLMVISSRYKVADNPALTVTPTENGRLITIRTNTPTYVKVSV